MPIYTRTGDKGQTSLIGGTRVQKSHERVEAYGTVDELNSNLGYVIAQINSQKLPRSKIKNELIYIQHDLFVIGSTLAAPQKKSYPQLEKRIKDFEELIDQLTKELPELQNFILPGGGKVGSLLHIARTIARRAERKVVLLAQKEEVDEAILKYLNRLSDLLFTIARYINHIDNKKEIKWTKKQGFRV